MYIFLIIVILLLPLPLYVLYKNIFSKSKEIKKAFELRRTFHQLLKKHKLSIDEVEIFDSKLIALDKKRGQLILIEYVGSSIRPICISLSDLESHGVVKGIDKIGGHISEVVLEFRFRHRKPVDFTFYDSSKDNVSAFSFLREKAKYWDAKIHFHANAYYDSGHPLEYVL